MNGQPVSYLLVMRLLSRSAKTDGPIYVFYTRTSKPFRRITFSSYRRSAVAAKQDYYQSVAKVLSERGFEWKSVRIEKVQSDSRSISFDEEWKKFVSLIADITQQNGLFGKLPTPDADYVWDHHFASVITNGGKRHELPSSLSDVLFEALRESMDGFVYPRGIISDNVIVLQSTKMNVGFGNQVHRDNIGFARGYGQLRKIPPNHGCFVFGMMDLPSSGALPATNEIYDLTATVELKLERKSCTGFAKVGNGKGEIEAPDFLNGHGPMGQAMMHSMDVWHCMARRGVTLKSIPVVILAGESESEDDVGRLCCLEAHIEIPEHFGGKFWYSIDRVVPFNETSRLDMDLESTISSDRRALAIYIRTMCRGLELAMEVSNNFQKANPTVPVSLCFHQFSGTNNETKVQLVASPIPHSNAFQESGMNVFQGELLTMVGPTKEFFSRLGDMLWFVDVLPKECLIKVSCASVHCTYVSHGDCKEALQDLRITCTRDAELQASVSKVLLGFCYIEASVSLVTIMVDLRTGDDHFKVLEHWKLREQGKLPQLWSAFCVLVRSLLLPMANANIIHLDIRSNAENTDNILVSANAYDSDNSMELRLIDFDSVVKSGSASGSRQKGVVHWSDLKKTVTVGVDWESAHRYLLWQILWIAYSWHPAATVRALDQHPEKPNAHNFVYHVFEDGYYLDFKTWLGRERVNALRNSTIASTITASTITETLDVLKCAFQSVDSTSFCERQDNDQDIDIPTK